MNDKEKVAQWMIERGYATGHGDTIEDLLKELEWQVTERERKWVGLTRRELDIATLGLQDLGDCYLAIEAKLKEKNS